MSENLSNPNSGSVEEIFHAALSLDEAKRNAYLDLACGNDTKLRRRVEALLLASASGKGFLPEQPAINLAGRFSHTATATINERPGDRIGNYELLEQIGVGGFGVVFKAQQLEPVRRVVALKIIKLGMDTVEVIARFEAERQVMATMDHPNIAKVLDAGATETGRPYFVMEYVEGISITEYCDRNRLTTRLRLHLFNAVCRAVQHAHTKGIIHRDIKPSNVLVTVQDGEAIPKLIDFGIAKATAQAFGFQTVATALGVLGTPAYMSPEQADLQRPDIDTRSDVYSLGVLLYELLTGQPPFETSEMLRLALDEALRTIREQEPMRPSDRLANLARQKLTETAQCRQVEPARLRHLLRGDLDCIVMKCLEKNRDRRYESASSLAMDVRRHLENAPITASPPGIVYRFQKLVRRNQIAFAAGAATFVAALGIWLYWWFLPGTLNLGITPADAQIEIDGRPQITGKMPMLLHLPAGVHELRFHKPEFTDEPRTIVVTRGGFASIPNLTLKHYQGTLDVDSTTPGTGIQFAGVDYFARIKDQLADTGTYDLLAFGDECFDVHHSLTIQQDQRVTDRFSLENGLSWKFPSTAVQGDCVVITNCPPGVPPVIAENMLDGIQFISSSDGSKLSSYPAAYNQQRSLVSLDLGGEIGRIFVSGAEEPENGPVLLAFADSWPEKLLWEWHGPKVGFTQPGHLSTIAAPNPGGSAQIAVAGRDGHVRLHNGRDGSLVRDIVISDLPLPKNPHLAAWNRSGQTYLLTMVCEVQTNSNIQMNYVSEVVVANAGTGKILWHKSLHDDQQGYFEDLDSNAVPWIVLCNERQWQVLNAETGEQLSEGSLPGRPHYVGMITAETNVEPSLIFEFADASLPMLAVRPSDGSVIWHGPTNVCQMQPQAISWSVFNASAGTFLVMLNNALVALEPTTGKPLWRVEAKPTGVLVDESSGNSYVTTDTGRLLCLNSTGATNWTLRLNENVRPIAIIQNENGGDRCNVLLQGQAKLITMVHWPRLLWSLPTGAAIQAAPHVTTDLSGKTEIIQLLPGDVDYAFCGLDPANGRTFWSDASYHLPSNRSPTLAALDGDGVTDVIAVGYDNFEGKLKLIVRRAADGRLIRAPDVALTGWISCTPAVADFRGIGKGDVAVSTWENPQIALLDGRTAEVLWQWKTEQSNMGGLTAADIDHDGLPDVVATSMDGHVYALRGKNGDLLWKSPGTSFPSWSKPVITDLNGDGSLQVLVTTLDGKLAVLDGKTGSLIWSPDINGKMKTSGQAVVTSLNGRKIILAPLGSVGVVAFDWPSRQEMWRSPANNPVIAAPVITDLAHDGNQEVIIGTTGGAVFVMRLADGEPLWHEQIAGGLIEADPVVADLNDDGIDDLLIASHDFSIYAIDGKAVVSSWRKP